MAIVLRLERPEEHKKVEEVIRDAFWGDGEPGCTEHMLAHNLRQSPAFVPELNYVAVAGETIVGNIMYSRAKIVREQGDGEEVLTFGPLSVLPQMKGQGIGAMLVKHTIAQAKRMGFRAIVIFGHPDYYVRFGFQNAKVFCITTASGANFDAFMALPLYEGALKGISGRFSEDAAFHVDEKKALAYDRQFLPKARRGHVAVDALLGKLAEPARRSIQDHGVTTLNDFERFSGREIAAWHGIGKDAMRAINETLGAHGYPKKKIW